MSYILLLQQIFNTFFPGCSTQLRFPTGGFVLEVNIEMISGTWWAWEEVVDCQTQPNRIWRFICSNISSNVIVSKYKIPKKICPGRSNRGKRGGHSSVIITCNLVSLSVLGDRCNNMLFSSGGHYHYIFLALKISRMYKWYVQLFQEINCYARAHFQWRSQCTWLLVLGRQQFLQRRWWNTRVRRLVEEPVTKLLSTRDFHCVAHLGIPLNIKVFQHVQKTYNLFLFKRFKN